MKGEILNAALVFATNAHAGQFDKSGMPYILHPLKVMHYLNTDNEILNAAALLHDVIEDCNVSYNDIYKLFAFDFEAGNRIVNILKCLTKQNGETKEQYKEKVFSSIDSMLIKKADLTHNSDIRRLKGITEKDIKRTIEYHTFYTEIETKLKEIKNVA